MDGLLDDHLLVDGDLDGNWVRLRHMDDLVDGNGPRTGHLHGVRHGVGLGDSHRLEDGHRVVLDDGNWDADRLGHRDGHGLRHRHGLRDGDDLLDGLVDGNSDGNVDGMRHRDDLGDRDEFWYMNHFGDWHWLGNMDSLVDDFNYRGLIVMAVAVSGESLTDADCAQKDQKRRKVHYKYDDL